MSSLHNNDERPVIDRNPGSEERPVIDRNPGSEERPVIDRNPHHEERPGIQRNPPPIQTPKNPLKQNHAPKASSGGSTSGSPVSGAKAPGTAVPPQKPVQNPASAGGSTPPRGQNPSGSKHTAIGVFALILLALLAGFALLPKGGDHVHQWSQATCTTPSTCIVCKDTQGGLADHRWSEPDCVSPSTCRTCGKTTGSTAAHQWSDPTCVSPSTCRICGKATGSAAGHRWTDATATAPKTCQVCGAEEGEPLKQSSVYLNELPYVDHEGKVWTMSRESSGSNGDSDITDSNAYKDESTPGHVSGPVQDYLGNSYTYGLTVDGLDYQSYQIIYELDGKYTVFSGFISMTPDVWQDPDADKGKYFEVYGDGKLLYRSPMMTNSLPAQSFTIDISGVDRLTISYPKTSGPSRMATIYDGKLS